MMTDALNCPAFVSDIMFGLFLNCYLPRRLFDSRLRATAKIRLTLLLLFPIFIFGQICFVALRHRFSKERKDFPIYDFIVAEPANTFAEAVGGESILPSVEGSGDEVVIDFLVSLLRVRTILKTIHRVSELAQLGVSDCQFDFV